MGIKRSCSIAIRCSAAPRFACWEDARIWPRFTMDCDIKSSYGRNDQIERDRRRGARSRERPFFPGPRAWAGGRWAHGAKDRYVDGVVEMMLDATQKFSEPL